MRTRLAVLGLAVLCWIALGASPARASCIQQTTDDEIARADVIAYGRVTAVGPGGGPLTFRPATVFKGTLAGSVSVDNGPSLGRATSVDYRAEAGEHVLYLVRTGSGFTTNDCSGSHPGPPTADELRLLGAGAAVPAAPDPSPLEGFAPLVPPLIGLAVLLAVALLLARRRAR